MAATGTSKLPPNGVPLFLSLSAHLKACTQWLLSSCPFSGTASRRTNTLLPCVCVCVCVRVEIRVFYLTLCVCGPASVCLYLSSWVGITEGCISTIHTLSRPTVRLPLPPTCWAFLLPNHHSLARRNIPLLRWSGVLATLSLFTSLGVAWGRLLLYSVEAIIAVMDRRKLGAEIGCLLVHLHQCSLYPMRGEVVFRSFQLRRYDLLFGNWKAYCIFPTDMSRWTI